MDAMYIAEEERLRVYQQIIDYYLRYVLIRCSRHTDSRNVAGRIALYTFISTYALAEKLKHVWQFGWLVDSLVDVIAEDIIGSQDTLQETSDPVDLLEDQALRDVAGAINALDVFTRQVLVLHHLEMLSTREISAAYGTSISEVRSTIQRGERKIVEYLACFWRDVSIPSLADVHSLLADLHDALSFPMEENITEFAISYLGQTAAADSRLTIQPEGHELN